MSAGGWRPAAKPWGPAEWTAEAKHVRDALTALGVFTPPCLPGEPEDCGGPTAAPSGAANAF